MPARKNPGGGKGQDKVWSDAIRIAAFRRSETDGPKLLAQAAETLIALAVKGDIGALREMGDRLDGKAVQGVEMGGVDGGAIEVADVSTMEAARLILAALREAAEAKAE